MRGDDEELPRATRAMTGAAEGRVSASAREGPGSASLGAAIKEATGWQNEVLRVVARKGSRVRSGLELDSSIVGELARDSLVVAAQDERATASGKSRRFVRVPLEGYVSSTTLSESSLGAAAAVEDLDAADLYCISDVHFDFEKNMADLEAAVERFARRGDSRRSALVVAGDVSHDMDALRRCFTLVKRAFDPVFFCPGNHELWVTNGCADSLEKLQAVMRLCDSLDVRTRPAALGTIVVVPLLSW